jgi:hypothetical protein
MLLPYIVIVHDIRLSVQQVSANQSNVQLCSYMPGKEDQCTVGLCSARPCVLLCVVESCAPPPPKAPSAPAQATSGLDYKQPYRGVNLDGVH